MRCHLRGVVRSVRLALVLRWWNIRVSGHDYGPPEHHIVLRGMSLVEEETLVCIHCGVRAVGWRPWYA